MSISIIIPYYNREKFLQRTLDSVAKQTLRPNELILVDNGSTDNSFEICKSFAEKYSDSKFNDKLKKHIHVETGIFGAEMKVELINGSIIYGIYVRCERDCIRILWQRFSYFAKPSVLIFLKYFCFY